MAKASPTCVPLARACISACCMVNRRWEGAPGMDFKLYGFSDKLPLLAVFVFRSLAQLHVAPARFTRVKEALLRNVSWL